MKLTKHEKKVLTSLVYQCVTKKWGEMCIRCGRGKGQMSHIYPKGRYKRLEFEPDNVIPLDFSCHIGWWHKNPIEAWEWLQTVVNKKTLEKLKMATLSRDKWSMDYKLQKLYLEQRLAILN